MQLDPLSLDVELQRLGIAVALDAEAHRRAFLAAHALDRIVQRRRVHGDPVDHDDDIARADAGLLGGRSFDGRDDDDLLIVHRHLDADPGVLPGAADLDLIVIIAVEVGGVRVKRGDHPARRRLQQGVIVELLDIVVLDALDDRSEGARVLPRDHWRRCRGLVRIHPADQA